MARKTVFEMNFAAVYGALIAKAERKGKTKADVNQLTTWLTGYSENEIEHDLETNISYGEFMNQAPAYHPNRSRITGKICGIQIETIEDSCLQNIRRLDKLVDWLAKGKSVEEILAKYQDKSAK